MSEPKVYVPGKDRKADELAKLYDQLEGSKVAARVDSPDERDASDPFGLNKKSAPTEDYEIAKRCAERFTKFFALVVQDFELGPKASLFMAELTFLNIFNADDIPLSKEAIDQARRDAFEYYAKSRPLVPSMKR